jgi:hypothetical protein
MPKKTCQLGLRRNSPLMIEFLWCLVIPTRSPVWNQITKDIKSINTQSATFRVIHASARMFSNFYCTSPLACLDRRSQIVSPGQFTSPVVQPAAALEKWNQSWCQGRPVWRGDLWKQFIYWWLLSPRDLRISFHIQDCVKLKPQVASKPFYLGCLFTIRSPRAVVLCIPLIYVVSSRHWIWWKLAISVMEHQQEHVNILCTKVHPQIDLLSTNVSRPR